MSIVIPLLTLVVVTVGVWFAVETEEIGAWRDVLARTLHGRMADRIPPPKWKLPAASALAAALVSFAAGADWRIQIGALMAGSVFPWVYLHEKEKRRRWKNFSELPDFLDLLSLGLSAGLTLERAWAAGAHYFPAGELKKELERVLTALSIGRSRAQALGDFSERLGDERLSMVFALVLQSMDRGSALESVMSEQAALLRNLRLLTLEKRAQTAGVRLLFPIFIFILPTVFLILFSPLVIRFSQGSGIF